MKGLGKMITQVERYLAYRRSLGYVLREEGRLLLDFARYADRVYGHKRTRVQRFERARCCAAPATSTSPVSRSC